MDRAKVFETAVVLLLILLAAILFTVVTSGSAEKSGNWSTSSVNATQFMYVGQDDTLYLFEDKSVNAISSDGSLLWTYDVQEPWAAVNTWLRKPVVSEGGGSVATDDTRAVFAGNRNSIYLYLQENPDIVGSIGGREKVVAITNGDVAWEKMLNGSNVRADYGDVCVQDLGDRLYVYHSYSLDVVGKNGTLLYRIDNVSDPAAIGPDGEVYLVKSAYPVGLSVDNWVYSPDNSFQEPSDTVEAYFPNGTLRWQAKIGHKVSRQVIDRTIVPDGSTLPLYRDGLLYLPTRTGLVAMDTDGREIWTARFSENVTMLQSMPFGPDGTVYMQRDNLYARPVETSTQVYAIGKDGKYTIATQNHSVLDLLGASDGIAYYGKKWDMDSHRPGLESLIGMNIQACDLRTGKDLWTCNILPARPMEVVADRQNVFQIFENPMQAYTSVYYCEDHPEMESREGLIFAVQGSSTVNFVQGRNLSYVSYYLYNYEYPIVTVDGNPPDQRLTPLFTGYESPYMYPAILNRSRFCYAAGIAALDRNGSALWNRPLDSKVTGIAVGNTTVFYGTKGGGISAIGDQIAIGLTITAGLYLLFRFFLVGAISRARNRLENNENRGKVLDYIRGRPGLTMYDIARDLSMNAGTVRYHLLVLGMNHKIALHKEGKYVRYFVNSGAYTADQRAIISLLRREPIRNLLAILCKSDGLTNAELSRALGISEPAVSYSLKGLTVKGIVIRETVSDGRVLYLISQEYAATIAERL